jgi:hypothetical protein
MIYFQSPQVDARSSMNIIADEIIHVDSDDRVYFTGYKTNHVLDKQLYR